MSGVSAALVNSFSEGLQAIRPLGYDTSVTVQIKLLAFAQTAQHLGFKEQNVRFTADETPRMLLARVAPSLSIASLRVAIDCEYHDWDVPIGNAAEMALIPPVSGG